LIDGLEAALFNAPSGPVAGLAPHAPSQR
jgi:hypothetical protein